jgi:hypothetical protein
LRFTAHRLLFLSEVAIRVATNTVHHADLTPSFVELPVLYP